MRNYIILNGKNSNQINGLLIQELPPISKPLLRNQIEEIDGRDGDIVTPLGYSAYDKEFTIGLYKDFDVNEVAAYFNSEGTVIFSNEPDKYYYYQITAQIDFERLVRYRTATVTMHCQPFKYSATEQPITEDVSGTVSDEGTNLALENTAEAPFNTLDLKGNTEQDTLSGNIQSPNPDYPQPIQVVTGLQTVEVQGKNLANPTPVSGGSNGVVATYNSQTGVVTVSGTAQTTWSNPFKVSNSIYLPAGTYTLKQYGELTNGRITCYTQGHGYQVNDSTLQRTFTITRDGNAYICITGLTAGNSVSGTIKFQLEAGSTATAFVPYSKQTYEINLGKNLFNKNDVEIGTILIDGSFSSTYTDVRTSGYVPVLPNTKYVTRGRPNGWGIQAFYTKDKTFIQRTTATSFTTPDNCYFARLECHRLDLDTFQCELGSTATTYAPYFEPIELCKLGDYQDYIWKDGEDWKVHKANGFVSTTTGSTHTINIDNTNTARIAFQGAISTPVAYSFGLGFSPISKGAPAGGWTTDEVGFAWATNTNIWWRFPKTMVGDTQEAIEEWASGRSFELYYPLATPTDTTITDQTLIEQLDDIYYHAHAYKESTHIRSSAAKGNVPLVIAAEVGEDNESTITNAGNYLSKPKITVYGSGDISLYINDMHVLQITLGDEGYINIDTAQMEAYKDTLDNLKNRLVIGDYSNARLKPGANKIHFTGKATKYIVENYSRWL